MTASREYSEVSLQTIASFFAVSYVVWEVFVKVKP